MSEIRTLHLPLPAGWQEVEGAAVPPLPWMKHTGITVETIRNATYADDGSVLALYAVRGTKAAAETLTSALRKEVGAVETSAALSWAVATNEWVSLNALLHADAVQGSPVLCTTRFTHAAADAHLDAVADALEQAEWRW